MRLHPTTSRLLLLLLLACAALAQPTDPVGWSLSLDYSSAPPGFKVPVRLTARIAPGWHVYSLSTPPGPIPTTVRLLDNPAVAGYQVYQPRPKIEFDRNFRLDTETFEGKTAFILVVELKPDVPPGQTELAAQIRYQVCDSRQCLPPVTKTATVELVVDALAAAPSIALPAGYTSASAAAAPVRRGNAKVQELVTFVLIAFGFGLAAIFTPCVFPMIPVIVAYFLGKRRRSRGWSIFQALLFSFGIIVLFSLLGLVTTAILGPFGALQLGSSPWVNAFIALLLLVFGLSLLGAFELAIPSSVLAKLDQASQRSGVLGTLLMGLTFSLTGFACIGPFMGTLLAGSVSGGGWKPLVGMVAFSSGLALPFFLLALFPSYLDRLPKSGHWMARVKIVMGFIILAVMLKYLSNVDAVLQWNILTRERYLGAWVALFALPGLYLLGFLRLEGVRSNDKLGIPRLLIGVAFLAFAASLIAGMFGGRLGELDAYVPLAPGQQSVWMVNEYEQALAKGRAEGKPVFLSFVGYSCSNCRWMKSNMFPRTEIAAALANYVPVELYTDGTDSASELNQQLQSEKFSTVSIPFYAIVNPDGKVIAGYAGLTRNPAEFLAFLRSGLPAK
jgi:thiol:disulfide interchange protein